VNCRARSLAVVATILVLGATVAVAQAITPPAGTPDLTQMTLQPADLAPGAQVASAYAKPPKQMIAEYDRNFAQVATSDGVALKGIDTQLLLADTTAAASGFFTELRTVYGSKAGHLLLAAEIAKSAGKAAHLKLKQIHFGKLHGIGVGAASLLVSITIRTKAVTLVSDVVALRIGAVIANLTIVAGKPRLAASVPSAIASAIAGHITTVLAATGSTGPSGPTGATGATG
jgi:hypothetical protein